MRICLTIFCLIQINCSGEHRAQENNKKVRVGAEMLIQNHLEELRGKRIGLVMNPTARVKNVHMLDTLLSLDVNITVLFAPEHGFRGDAGAGEIIEDGVDKETGLTVYSLYGSNKSPTKEMMSQVDILLFDMQDVGARFYTYNSTMKYIIEASTKYDKEVWILDRPNPAGGNYVAGWVLEDEFSSFVGTYPIPIAHGLTLGELALMAIGEDWFSTDKNPKVRIIGMEGWKREMKWAETGLEWIAPSPNLPTAEHAYVYLGTCLFEGTSLSEGRGTESPFLTIGSPSTHIDISDLKEISKMYNVGIDTLTFTPRSIQGKSLNPKHQDKKNYGVRISNTKELNDPVRFGLDLLHLAMKNSKEAEYKSYIFKLAGSKKVLEDSTLTSWGYEFETFLKKRNQYLMY